MADRFARWANRASAVRLLVGEIYLMQGAREWKNVAASEQTSRRLFEETRVSPAVCPEAMRRPCRESDDGMGMTIHSMWVVSGPRYRGAGRSVAASAGDECVRQIMFRCAFRTPSGDR